MTAFVILAAGRGTRIGRVGETFHKALVPLGDKAVLSHLYGLAPTNSRIIVCLGHRGKQIQDYTAMAHPSRNITFVDVEGWDEPGGGPGASLLAAKEAVGDDELIFTSCDTIWTQDRTLWRDEESWAAVAPIPAGTGYERWCRMQVDNETGFAVDIVDKQPGDEDPSWFAYTGLARIARRDLPAFWTGVESSGTLNDELQVTGGLDTLRQGNGLGARRIQWIDVGDADAYAQAVARMTGYDFTKINEATYVLPEEGRVVKFWSDSNIATQRRQRALHLLGCIPGLIHNGTPNMLAYSYIPGVTGYEALETNRDVIHRVLSWAHTWWRPTARTLSSIQADEACDKFYRGKTLERIEMLKPELQDKSYDVVQRVNWNDIIHKSKVGTFHGDFNLGNIIVGNDGELYGIDWRQAFGSVTAWGDIRYDLAKLLAGLYVHWGRARYGDFRPWPEGEDYAVAVREDEFYDESVEVIAALSLINSAPLHAPPLDEILVARAVGWLESLI